ncbi:phospholipase D family protein [Ruegeria lacuscaerulensis]|uniref:phospholipase D family protein n=1 Tax=Ruegeria lacuscaerulensis TaxID=55218 RepID=UPI001481212A|nr:phospholipase D family protein [Ruegeria lacuscaerulensis]
MPDFVNGNELLQCLATAIRDAKDVRLAVAFWGDGAADALGIDEGFGAKFRIVCNLMSGGTNPNEIRRLQVRGAEVRQLNDLHAKVGVTDDLSFLGSSNMSTNGLGDEGSGASWREANIVYRNSRPEIEKIFEEFWRDSTEISKADLQNAEAVWTARRKGNAVASVGVAKRSLLDVLRTSPEYLGALNVRMVVYDTVTDPEELAILDRAEAEAQQRYNGPFEVYWDWESMETEAADAYLVDFDWPAKGKIDEGNLYRREKHNFKDFSNEAGIFHAVLEIETIEGITFGAADKFAIRGAFHRYVQDGHKGEYESQRSYNFPISELAPYLPPNK